MSPNTNDGVGLQTPATVVILSPSLSAVSGVSTHANLLFRSTLADEFHLVHFQVGSEGRQEGPLRRASRLASSFVEFAFFLLRSRPAIVHLNPSLESKALWRDSIYLLISRLLACRVVFQIHGGAIPEEFFRGHRVRNAIVRRVLRSADAVVLLSHLEYRLYRKFDSRVRLEVIANAINPSRLLGASTHRAATRQPLRLAYLGRLIASKGIFEIIEALRQLRDRRVSAKLSIAGSGPDESRLRTFVEHLGLNDCVTFRGPLFNEDKDRLWRDTDIFVFPTYFPEGMPYALLESMAAGAVPVTCPIGAIPEVIQDEVHGILIPPRDPVAITDALQQLDADRTRIERMSAAGRERILQNHTIERLARDFRRLYSSL